MAAHAGVLRGAFEGVGTQQAGGGFETRPLLLLKRRSEAHASEGVPRLSVQK